MPITYYTPLGNSNSDVIINDSIYHKGNDITRVRFPSNNIFTIETNNAERLRVDASGNLGIGTSSPNFRLSLGDNTALKQTAIYLQPQNVAGADNEQRISNGRVSSIYSSVVLGFNNLGGGLADASYISFRTYQGGNAVIQSSGEYGVERVRITNGGDVGIGTSSPDIRLDVRGTDNLIQAREDGTSAAWRARILSRNSSANVSSFLGTYASIPGVFAHNYALNAWSSLYVNTTSGSTDGGNVFIAGSGNVGIGTNSPVSKLSITGDSVVNDGLVNINNTRSTASFYPALRVLNDRGNHSFGIVSEFRITNSTDSDRPAIVFSKGGTNNNWAVGMGVYAASVDSFSIGYRSAYPIAAWSTAYITILTGGNVGIGTTNPGNKLSISGSINQQLLSISQSTAANNSFGDYVGISFGLSNEVSQYTGNPAATIQSYLERGNNGFGLDFFTRFNAGALNRVMRLNADGNVGIGTTNPGYTLEVNGSFAATTKSFVIDHPTKEGMKLRYGSLESPYHGIRLTGEAEIISNICCVKLPEYIYALCKDQDAQIQITNIKHGKILWVENIDIKNNCFTVGMDRNIDDNKKYKFYWSFTAIRKDIEDLIVEE
jgi:hypothetical protein